MSDKGNYERPTTGLPSATLEEAQAIVETKTAPRVTKEAIEAKLLDVSYLTHGLLTICVVTVRNGFIVVGKAAAADARNHDPAVGERYAYEDAFRQLWPLEGYVLRSLLSGEVRP